MNAISFGHELVLRMLVIGCCFGIRSKRRLGDEVQLNLAYRWFCRLGLEDRIPDHSSLSKNRRGRFRESDTSRRDLENVLRRCRTEGPVSGTGFSIHTGVVSAGANRARGVPHFPRPYCRTGGWECARPSSLKLGAAAAHSLNLPLNEFAGIIRIVNLPGIPTAFYFPFWRWRKPTA